MTNETLLKKLTEVKEKSDNHIITRYLDDIIAEVKSDIASAEAKKSGKYDRYAAALKFAKRCVKEKREFLPKLAGAFPTKSGEQAICDGVLAVVYKKPYDGLPTIDESFHNDVLEMERVMPSSSTDLFEVELPDINTLNTNYKLKKAEHTGRPKDFSHLTKITSDGGDNRFFNTLFLIELIKCVGDGTSYFMNKGCFGALYIEGDGAKGLLLPVRVSENQMEKIA